MIAYCMGYTDIHLYGFDTCIVDGESHAYEFSDPVKEKIKKTLDIRVGTATFTMAEYMLGQFLDFQNILKIIGDRVKFTVHGEGALKTLFDIASEKVD